MKKIFTIAILLLICSFSAIGCGKQPSISYSTNEITLARNETYVFNDKDVVKKYYKGDYKYKEIDDKDVIDFQDNTITPKKIGSAIIRLYLVGREDICFDIKILVTNEYLAENVSVKRSIIDLDLNNKNVTGNKINVRNFNCTEEPVVTFDSNIISYYPDTGIIIARGVGSTEVVIKFKKCSTSFIVNVTGTIYATYMKVDDMSLFVNTLGKFPFVIYPENANSTVFWSSDMGILKVDNNGNYEALATGTVQVGYRYYLDKDKFSESKYFTVTVCDKVTDLDISISNFDGTNPPYYLLENVYRLDIELNDNIDTKYLEFSENINITKKLTNIDVGKYYIEFQYKNTGYNEIVVKYERTLNQVVNMLTDSIGREVHSNNTIKVKAKWSAYYQDKLSDGKYHLTLTPDNIHPDYLTFHLFVGEVPYDKEYQIYYTKGSESKYYLDENLFQPSEGGEYTFYVLIEGKVIDTFVVIVG